MPVIHLDDIGTLTEFDAGADALGSKKEIEIIVGGDDTISMRGRVDGENGSGPMKGQVSVDIMTELALRCWKLDSQAQREAAAGVIDEDTGLPAGGVMVVRWGRRWYKDGDWNPHTLEQQAAKFQFREDGTYIMQMVEGIKAVYTKEFCVDEAGQPTPVDDRPALLLGGITDGACFDQDKFVAWARKLGGDTFLVLALIGSGDEYEAAREQYSAIAESNPHFVLVLVGADPNAVQKVPEAFQRLAGQYQQAA
jgi:hypothetical protein